MRTSRTTVNLLIVLVVVVTFLRPAAGDRPEAGGVRAAKAPGPPPAWVAAYLEAMIGTWIADNRPHRSDEEPFDAYGIEWTWGVGKKSIAGRLFAMREGKEVGTVWDLREFWHPGEGQLIASQFGSDGTYGVGPHARKADGTMEMLQVFHAPDGGVRRIGHRSELKGNEFVSRSFDVQTDGTWKPARTYVFRRK
jgi:hypothetical protein